MEIPLNETQRMVLATAPNNPLAGRGRAPGRRGSSPELHPASVSNCTTAW